MGKAIEWLSYDERASLALHLLDSSSEKNGDIWGRCPFHPEKTIGAFHYNVEKDLFYCHGCNTGGDLIKLFSFVQYSRVSEIESFKIFASLYAPKKSNYRPYNRTNVRLNAINEFKPRDLHIPNRQWSEKAETFVFDCRKRMVNSQEVWKWLAVEKYIDISHALKFNLGWNDQPRCFLPEDWGLESRHKNDIIFVGIGLTIATRWENQVVKIKTRLEIPYNDQRYFCVKGSSNLLSIYNESENVMVVESELDGILLASTCPDWSFVATGGAAKRPDKTVSNYLNSAKKLAICLDNDDAGYINTKFYLNNFPKAVNYPLPIAWGKDPSESAANNHDLRKWILCFDRYSEEERNSMR
ncbi:MAG: toprim domain-containing protein [Deltaproteobacteria bacterium]|jgi:hypothetical protein|nr:toprim domain-containing protein [Deltaproteobacteria bacterium]